MKLSMIQNLAIWGDSLLKGIIFDEKTSRYKPLKTCSVNLFSKAFPFTVKNNSRFGCTAPKAEANLEKSLQKGFSADAVLLEFGGNDCDFNWAKVSANPEIEHQPNTPLPEFVDSMKNMVDELTKHNIKPILSNLPPISSEMYFDWISRMDGVDGDKVLYWLKDKTIIYRQQESYSHAIEKLAYEYNLPLIDIREPFLKIRDYKSYLCVDGIHLNEKGQSIMCSTFKNYAAAM